MAPPPPTLMARSVKTNRELAKITALSTALAEDPPTAQDTGGHTAQLIAAGQWVDRAVLVTHSQGNLFVNATYDAYLVRPVSRQQRPLRPQAARHLPRRSPPAARPDPPAHRRSAGRALNRQPPGAARCIPEAKPINPPPHPAGTSPDGSACRSLCWHLRPVVGANRPNRQQLHLRSAA